ncbi:MAG TPA: c-type cytochrome [Gaiellaceae bacterium]|nr:c-type cytochrome [Gaiellaceae bacterium]
MARRRRNPWVSLGEVVVWVLFAVLLFPVGFAGWAVGHYTTLGGGKSSSAKTVTVTGQASTATVTVTTPAAATTAPATTAPATTAPTTTAPATTTTAAAAGDPAKGKAVFTSSACASCHTFAPAGSTGTIGPNLDTAPAADAKKAGMALTAFLHQSIVDPNAYIPSGYAKGLMPANFGQQLSKTQLDDLVAFLASGAK